jgi:hypothetical protein
VCPSSEIILNLNAVITVCLSICQIGKSHPIIIIYKQINVTDLHKHSDFFCEKMVSLIMETFTADLHSQLKTLA